MVFIKRLSWIFLLLFSSQLTAKEESCLSFHVIDIEPMGYSVTGGEPVGVHWEYLEALAKESGLCINTFLMPYARIWKSIEDGGHDGGIIFASPPRKHLTELVAPIRSIKTVVIGDKSIPLKSYDDLYNFTIAKTRGSHLGDQFDQDPSLKKLPLTDYKQVIFMLKKGRVNAVAGGAHMLSYQLYVQGFSGYLDLSNKVNIGTRIQWLQLSAKSKHLDKAPQLAAALNRLKQSGELDRIMTKYYGKDWAKLNQ